MTYADTLKRWRGARRYSQLALATEAGVSQRHISFLETGRSRPSREMVLHLSRVLDVPLGRRNEMLTAAGFAPEYSSGSLDPDGPIVATLQFLLDVHTPAPAVVVDGAWNVLMSNSAAAALTARLLDPATAPIVDGVVNLIRLTLHPDGLRPHIVNFDQVALVLTERLDHELARDPDDRDLMALRKEIAGYPDMPVGPAAPADVVAVPIHYRANDFEVKLITTIAEIGAPLDTTVAGIRVETFFPMDETSRAALAGLL